MNDSSQTYPVTIRQNHGLHLAALLHKGSYTQIGDTFHALMPFVTQQQLLNSNSLGVAVYLDNPYEVDEEQLRSYAAITVAKDAVISPPLETYITQAATYAVIEYVGPYANIPPVYHWFFEVYMLSNGMAFTHQPCFELYLNNPVDTLPQNLITHIYVPVQI